MIPRWFGRTWRLSLPAALATLPAAAFAPSVSRAAGAAALLAQVQEGGQSVFEQAPSHSYIVDGVLFVVLVGAALFVICRSSRRT